MNPVKIITDSTADIPMELRNKYDIQFVPLYVTIGGQTYKDQVDIDTARLYQLVEETNELPKTAAPSVQDMINSFTTWIDKGHDILFFGISSKLSATIQSANLAAQEFDEGRVKVIDSENLCMGIGLMAIKAAQWASQGLGAEEIYRKVEALKANVRTSFVIDTLKYLHMGGRCSSIELIAGSVLRIRPQILVKDGGLIVQDKFRGKKEKVLNNFYQKFVSENKKIDTDTIVIAHSSDLTSAEYLKNKVVNDLKPENIYLVEAGTVISSHCGPGTVGIIYVEKDE